MDFFVFFFSNVRCTRLMGCFQSVPRRDQIDANRLPLHSQEMFKSGTRTPGHEFVECRDIPMVQTQHCRDNSEPIDQGFFDAEDSPSSANPLNSINEDVGESGIAEFADSDGSSEEWRPRSPELVISPNPMTPEPPIARSTERRSNVGKIVKALLGEPPKTDNVEEFISVPASPCVVVKPRSRIGEIAELRNEFLMLQVFFVWRFDAMKSNSDQLKMKLDDAGKASEIILNDNIGLKARLVELERAISIVQSIPLKSVGTDTTDLAEPLFKTPVAAPVFPPMTPPVQTSNWQDTEGFMTPISEGPESPGIPVAISIATPRDEEPKKDWQEFTRPSVAAPPPFANPAVSTRKEKLRAISEDLTRLTESLTSVDLKHRSTRDTQMGA